MTHKQKYKRYVNLRHKGITESERAENLRYLEQVLATESTKVGANFLYDLDWLENGDGMNLKVKGKYQDTQSRECLLDAYARSYSLTPCQRSMVLKESMTKKLLTGAMLVASKGLLKNIYI